MSSGWYDQISKAYYRKEVKFWWIADLLYWETWFQNNIGCTTVGLLILCTDHTRLIWWLAVCNWRWCTWKQSSTTYIQLIGKKSCLTLLWYSGCTRNRTTTLAGHTPWRRKQTSYTAFLDSSFATMLGVRLRYMKCKQFIVFVLQKQILLCWL